MKNLLNLDEYGPYPSVHAIENGKVISIRINPHVVRSATTQNGLTYCIYKTAEQLRFFYTYEDQIPKVEELHVTSHEGKFYSFNLRSKCMYEITELSADSYNIEILEMIIEKDFILAVDFANTSRAIIATPRFSEEFDIAPKDFRTLHPIKYGEFHMILDKDLENIYQVTNRDGVFELVTAKIYERDGSCFAVSEAAQSVFRIDISYQGLENPKEVIRFSESAEGIEDFMREGEFE